ncbi:NAD(P)-binding protein [Colletotrichum zoysiae]|uniref:NAD(P)-binding protein n=1 Tax=Colletotrichum zoysiae TaxID=1216348 RepID=A0AAD9HGI6_9PEZI|nr:NAD(P)-binding protein [Colletotrichum zoysiae]
MTVKIFLTGATGYIGGDALYHLYQKHPEFEYALLVRSEDKANKVVEKYPTARIVLGGLDDSETLEREAAWADVVIHTADSSDHAGAATAISKGLVRGHSASRPGFWLHTGGTGILTYFDSEVRKVFGEPDDKVFDDYEGVGELVNLPAAAFHRNVDEIVLATGREHAASVKTAVVCPPTIYGEGRGPVSGRGRQVYELAHFVLGQGYCPRIGRGLARWNNVHVRDLSAVFALLVEAALDPARKGGDDAGELWGERGYYLTENGEHVWGELSEAVGREAHAQGLLGEPEVRELSFDEAVESPAGFEAASWGMNSRGRAVRARKVLGWEPREGSLEDEIPTIVRSEAARAGL